MEGRYGTEMNDRSRIILCNKMIKGKFLVKYQLIEICAELKEICTFVKSPENQFKM